MRKSDEQARKLFMNPPHVLTARYPNIGIGGAKSLGQEHTTNRHRPPEFSRK